MNRLPLRAALLAWLIFCGPAAPTTATAQPAGVDALRRLAEAGDHAGVVETADAVVAALPADARLMAWRLDFRGQVVDDTLLGERHAYVMTRLQRWGPGPGPRVELPDARPVLRHDAQGYDETQCVTCVDGSTGKLLWTRRLAGGFRFMVGPGDHLWALAGKLYRLDAATGDVGIERALAPGWRDLHGIVVDGAVVAHEQDGGTRRPEALNVLDLGTGQTSTLRHRPGQWSPNRLRVLRRTVAQSPGDVTETVSLTAPDGQSPQWTYGTPGYSANDPVWFEGDVLVLSGTMDTRAAVARLDGATGEVEWATVLSGGAYALEHVYLRNNSHLSHRWDAVGPVAGRIAAIDGRGVVHFLDARSGEIVASASRVAAHFAMPRQVGDNVVFAGTDSLVAVPVKALFGPREADEGEALLLKGRSLLALGRPKDALAVAQSLTVQAPEFAGGWGLRADAARAASDSAGEVLARVRALELTGGRSSPELLASHGLLARIATGPVTAELAPVGPFVYAGSRDGTLSKVEINSLDVVETTRFAADISSLQMSDDTLYRWGTNRRREPVGTFVRLPPAPPAGDPLYPVPAAPVGAPREWHSEMGYDGQVVRHEGRLYRPLHRGRVRVLDGQTVTTHDAALPGIERWDIHLGAGGPLGYGTGGVYALDERLVPVRKLIDSGADTLNHLPYQVPSVASDGRTIAAAMYRSDQSVVQVWSADGKQKLREEPARITPADGPGRGRLLSLNGGYFFSGDELVWVPADPERPAWRFALQPLPRRPMRHQELRDYAFGTPRVVGDKLFVACREGGVFVFAIDRLTAAATR